MKKKLYIILLFSMLVTACDDFIDKQPLDQLSQETFFTNEATTQAALMGAYRSLTSSFAYGQALIVIPEFAAGHMRHISNFPEYMEYQNFNIRIDNPWALNIWTSSYQTINAVNNIIGFAPQIDGFANNPALQNLVLEARWIRALTYFNLVRAWGDVPLLLNPTTPATTSTATRVSRNSTQEVYTAIVSDLEAAMNLPMIAGTGIMKGRANGYSSRALLSKVHLYLENYTESARLANEVINSMEFTLVSNYSSIWQNENSQESIFELQFDEQTTNAFVQVANPASRQEFFASDLAYDLFEENDLRRDFSINEAVDNSGNINLYVGKYRNFNPATQNIPIIRLAEIYLICAEALARSQGTPLGEPQNHLGEVRTRAGLETTPTPALEAFIRAVQLEKRKELIFESEAYFDLIRTGLAFETLGLTNPQRALFPIPQLELDINNNLTQNPGY
ncbi:RagB/SusD family nutrient uptake outer membrane protein [Anditalea andensis]|uniref:Carbohydrate-binding protein SusD n=1 Tax=Anditalea andensis TaxID=1048983 RepID=A0A074LHA7_9BACT|nr:RagB/SusD family nutrient uptake outer membrane protein [Anditalea andensis]KEO73152.1 hypothetical protein EL17_12390 [Anditalea andensis]